MLGVTANVLSIKEYSLSFIFNYNNSDSLYFNFSAIIPTLVTEVNRGLIHHPPFKRYFSQA
jgi:hypothetical protein